MTEPIVFLATVDPSPAELAEVLLLLRAVAEVDGRPEVSGEALPGDFRGGSHLFATRAGALVGYAHLNTAGDTFGRQVGELFVRPTARRTGVGAGLLVELADLAGVRLTGEAGDTLRVWAHGDQPAAAGLAARYGLRKVREMLRMRRPLPADVRELPESVLPPGVRLRAFVPGRDEPAVVEVNHRAFSWHPEQGALTVEDLRAEEAQPWFDPAGFLLAVDEQDTLLGFHWTKVHADGAAGDEPAGVPMGEVYVVGVNPDAQGGGLGRALTMAGLRHLVSARGMDRVMLYVESDNAAAVAVYHRLGFTTWDADVQYSH